MEWKKEWDKRPSESRLKWADRVMRDPDYIRFVGNEEAQKTLSAGRPVIYADKEGVYWLYPDGRKEYTKRWGDEQKTS